MNTWACVTSQNQYYYDLIGEVMLKSWSRYWPEPDCMYLYSEEFQPEAIDRVNIIDWATTCYSSWLPFSQRATHPHALKFGKKAWATVHALRNIDVDFLVWLDSDLLFWNNIPRSDLERAISAEQLVALFDSDIGPKEGRVLWSAESGFVIFNRRHENFSSFVDQYEAYMSAEIKPEGVLHWWDNQVLMLTASHYLDHVHDLTQYRMRKTQTPLNHCWLGEYMGHFKSNNKNRLTKEEQLIKAGIL